MWHEIKEVVVPIKAYEVGGVILLTWAQAVAEVERLAYNRSIETKEPM